MIASVRMEIRKFLTTRMWWVLLVLMVAYMAFMAATMGFALTSSSADVSETNPMDNLQVVRAVYTIAVSFGYVFPVLIGTMSVTGEYRHRTIVPTLLFYPSRTRFVVSKLLGAVPVGLLFGIAGVFTGVAAGGGVIALTGGDPMLSDAAVWRSIGLGVLALTVWTLVGVGVGSMITNQIAAVVAILAFTQFVEPILRIALPQAGTFGAKVVAYLPGATGEAMAEGSIYTAFSETTVLSWWQGALVLFGYAIVFSLIGRLTTLRRDVA